MSERTYTCEVCALVLDRDVNAARNLAAYGQTQVAGSGPETLNGRGADIRRHPPVPQPAMKRQPGTADTGQTGTVPPPHGGTANLMSANAH
jgi:hypothetical protein